MKKQILTKLLLLVGLLSSSVSWGQTIVSTTGSMTFCPGWATLTINSPEDFDWVWSNGMGGSTISYLFEESAPSVTIYATGTRTVSITTVDSCELCKIQTPATNKSCLPSGTKYTCKLKQIKTISAVATVRQRPAKPIFQSPTVNVPCGDQTNITYTVNANANVENYEWNYSPWTAVTNSNTNSIILHTTSYGAPVINVRGEHKDCPGLWSDLNSVTINRKPLAPTLDAAHSPPGGSISRDANTEYTFTINPSAGADSYVWSCVAPLQNHIGSGTNNGIAVNWVFPQPGNGTFLVTPHSACGNGATATLNFNVLCTPPPASEFAFCVPPLPTQDTYNPSHGWSDQDSYPRFVTDVNKDGYDDIVGFGATGVVVSINNTTGGFKPYIAPTTEFATTAWTSNNTYPRFLADMNHDGYKDIVGFSAFGVVVALNKKLPGLTVDWYASDVWYAGMFGVNSGWLNNNVYPRMIADVDGDGWNDIVGFAAGGVVVSLNKANPLNPGLKPGSVWCSSNYGTNTGWSNNSEYPRRMVDMNNDGQADVVGFHANGVLVALTNTAGTDFLAPVLWLSDFGTEDGYEDMGIHPRYIVDMNDDGFNDIVGFKNGARVALSNASTTATDLNSSTLWLNEFSSNSPGNAVWPSLNETPRLIGNVNNDNYPDIVAFTTDAIMVSLNDGGTSFKCPTVSTLGYPFTQATGWTNQSEYPRYLANLDGTSDSRKEIIGFGPLGITVMNCSNGINFREGEFEIVDNFSAAVEKLNCYPNPFTHNLTIEYKATSADVTVSIFNSIGGKIKEVKGTSGENSLSFSGENLENGTYFCILYENGKITAKKSIVLQK